MNVVNLNLSLSLSLSLWEQILHAPSTEACDPAAGMDKEKMLGKAKL